METENRVSRAHMMQTTLEEINSTLASMTRRSTLSQAVRIALSHLRVFYPDADAEVLYQRLVFKTNHSMAFQKSEIAKLQFVSEENGVKVEVTLNFLGLFGSSSPLPTHYSEEVLSSYDDDRVLYDFLNLFNHHMEKYVFQVWQRQRYYIQYRYDLQDKFSGYMLSLIGMHGALQQPNSTLNLRKLLPFLGVLSMRQKSAGTLVSILRHYLDHDDITIEQGVVKEMAIPQWQRPSLGEGNMTLSRDFLIGECVKTKIGKIRIVINNVTKEQLFDYSVHGCKMGELQELMKLALSEPVDYEVVATLQPSETEPFSMSCQHLGVNSWLGVTESTSQIVIKD